MLCGLMDHWVPSHDAISSFWNTPFEEMEPDMARLCDELSINNFTFYTKWYSNGLKSALPFLSNHPESQNVITDNDWGRRWIEWLHKRGMTCGAMIQSYVYEPGRLPAEAVLGVWKETCKCTGYPAGSDSELANPEWPGFAKMYGRMLEEQIREFPSLDAIFLEFEGLGSAEPTHAMAKRVLDSGVDPQLAERCQAIGWPIHNWGLWTWTREGQIALEKTLCEHITEAHNALDRAGFTGIRGIVFHAMGYETPYILRSLPNKDWWLLPWHYWGWDFDRNTPENTIRRQIDWCKESFASMVNSGHSLCYIGNCTLPTERYGSIREMVEFCREAHAAGYLGMGNPLTEHGLRWHGATRQSQADARRLYRELFPK